MQGPVIDAVEMTEALLGYVDGVTFVGCVKFNGALADVVDPAIIAKDIFVKSTDKA
jgi:hypothetical protein